ncbi:MAG: tail fiber domain-containing protein, partial [Pseudomonadota bacterium]|nr:tail fiber domain-containing protein [Pseudomonadota bacterium]
NATHQYGLYNEVGQQYVSSGTGVFNKVTGLYGTTTGYHIELNKNNNAYTNGYGLTLNIKPTGSGGTNYFIYCQKDDTNLKMRVLQNGNLQNANNSYGSTSDVKLKENIVDANSQWDDIKSLRVRNFNFKDDPDKVKMLGVVAQEAEVVSAGLIESDNDIEVDETTGEGKIVGTTKFVKYSILYMKAVKCLQEAQARIETLEAKVSALEGS